MSNKKINKKCDRCGYKKPVSKDQVTGGLICDDCRNIIFDRHVEMYIMNKKLTKNI